MNFDFTVNRLHVPASATAYIWTSIEVVMLSIRVSDDEMREKVAEQGLIKDDGVSDVLQ